MHTRAVKTLCWLSLALFTSSLRAVGQQTFYEQFRSHNAAMAEVQPSWMGPLVQPDPRLSQVIKVSVSDAHAPGAQILSYGNNHGFSFIAGTRFQFDLVPPSYFRNHSAALPDGFGSAASQVKYRIASGNAERGNYVVTAALARAFGGGFAQNGLLTGFYCPKLAAGKAFGRFNVQEVVSGVLPVARVNEQGRVVEWNTTGQFHTTPHTWVDIEDNTAAFYGGPADGQVQNFVTPAAYYLLRRRGWEATHASLVFDAGMQIATSRFHLYDHNLITEMRILF